MIIQEVGKDKYYDKIVLLKCDECKKEFQRTLSRTKRIRKKRGKEEDICLKCSFLPKYRNYQHGSQRYNWKGGRFTHSAGYHMQLTYLDKVGGARYEFVHVLNMQEKISRKLYKNEKIHHIDCNKINNNINNLFLCDSEKHHQLCHHSMTRCGYQLLGKLIYFNRDKEKYQLHFYKNKLIKEFYFLTKYKVYCNKVRNTPYEFIRVNGRARRYHVAIIENFIGRSITREECVHHIDGNTVNNNINNLCLMTNSAHTKAHRSIEYCVAELYRQGIVDFNRETGKYFVIEK